MANRLGLDPDDGLLSSPETLFDLAGVYPLKMRVVGILERSYSADDLVVLVDLKTAWVVQGLVHGHEDVTPIRDASVIMDRSDSNVVASAMALVLVFALSLRLRQREIRTVCGIGGSRSTVARLLAAEITIILFMSGVLCAAAIGIVDWYSSDLVRRLFIG